MVEGLAELLADIDLSLTCYRYDRLYKSKFNILKQKLHKIFPKYRTCVRHNMKPLIISNTRAWLVVVVASGLSSTSGNHKWG